MREGSGKRRPRTIVSGTIGGGSVRLQGVKDFIEVDVPDHLPLPTCEKCGKLVLTQAEHDRLDDLLREKESRAIRPVTIQVSVPTQGKLARQGRYSFTATFSDRSDLLAYASMLEKASRLAYAEAWRSTATVRQTVTEAERVVLDQLPGRGVLAVMRKS